MITLLDRIKMTGLASLKGKNYIDSNMDGAHFEVLTPPRVSAKSGFWIRLSKKDMTICYQGETALKSTKISEHYGNTELE